MSAKPSFFNIETIENDFQQGDFSAAPDKNIQKERMFYFQDPSSIKGGMKMDWNAWSIISGPDFDSPKHVLVKWEGGLSVKLHGVDAFNFLKIVRDKNVRDFAPKTQN